MTYLHMLKIGVLCTNKDSVVIVIVSWGTISRALATMHAAARRVV